MNNQHEDVLVYTVQVNYKSGISMKFETLKFDIEAGRYTWNTIGIPDPVDIAADNIESVWVVGVRTSTIDALNAELNKILSSRIKP